MPFDEQVGNSNYLTMTPGSAVAGQLQNILAQKRNDARQAMLDELTSRNVNSQIADRDQQAKTNEAYRAALASNREALEEQHRASMLSPNQDLMGTDLDYWQQHNPSMVIPGQEEQPQFDYEGQPAIPAAGPKFRGLPAQIETERKNKIQQAAIQQLQGPDFKNLPRAQQAFIYEQATNKEPSAAIFEDPKADQWSEVMDADGNPTGNWAPANAHFLQRPQKDPTPPGMTPFQGEDTDHNPVSLGYNPRTNAYEPSKIPTGLRVVSGSKGNAVPKASTVKPPRVTDPTWKLWTAAVNNSVKKAGDVNSEHELNAQAARIAQELGLGAHLSQPILAAFKNPKNRGRTPSFAGGTPEEIEASQKLWGLLTGGFQAPSVE